MKLHEFPSIFMLFLVGFWILPRNRLAASPAARRHISFYLNYAFCHELPGDETELPGDARCPVIV